MSEEIDYDFVIEKYWNTEPAWSGLDLINHYGCSKSSLYRFMVRNNIPRRNQSEAIRNARSCVHKKENMDNALKELWENPEFREKASERMIKQNEEQWKNPEFIDMQSKLMTERLKIPEMREAINKANYTEEVKKKISDSRKENWKNPKYRKKQTEAIKKAMNKPEVKKRASKKSKEQWANPEARKRASEKSKKRYHNNPNHPLRIKNERYWTGDKKERG